MDSKILIADPKKCTGCRSCEIVCSLGRTGVSNPARARIRVINWQNKGLFLPVSCQHCEDAPCRKACPQEAISRDAVFERVVIDYSKCVGCRTCVYACPFGAMKFDADRGRPFKCDLCGGDPLCIDACDDNALAFSDPGSQHYPRIREMARTFKKPFNRRL